jgi:hypothetical protein
MAHWRASADGALDLGLIKAMPETDEETPKGARWAQKLQMS